MDHYNEYLTLEAQLKILLDKVVSLRKAVDPERKPTKKELDDQKFELAFNRRAARKAKLYLKKQQSLNQK